MVKFCFLSLVLSKSFSVFLFRYVASWIDRRRHQSEKANLTILFDKYIPACLDKLRTSFKTITPIPENSLVQVCHQMYHATFQSYGSWTKTKFLLPQEDRKHSECQVALTLLYRPLGFPEAFCKPLSTAYYHTVLSFQLWSLSPRLSYRSRAMTYLLIVQPEKCMQF